MFLHRACARSYLTRNGRARAAGANGKLLTRFSINSKTGVTGMTYPETFRPTQQSTGITSNGGMQAFLTN